MKISMQLILKKWKLRPKYNRKFSQITQLNNQIMWYSMIYILYLILRVWGDTGGGLNGNRENQMVHRARDHDVLKASFRIETYENIWAKVVFYAQRSALYYYSTQFVKLLVSASIFQQSFIMLRIWWIYPCKSVVLVKFCPKQKVLPNQAVFS